MSRGRAGQGSASADRPTIVISANSFWNIANFRAGLVAAIVSEGYRLVIVAPDADREWAAARGAEAVDISINRSGLNPVRDALLILDYHKLIRRFRPNIFIGFTAKPNIYGSVTAAIWGVPALPNVSGLGTAFIKPGPLSIFVGSLYRLAFRKCPLVFFQNTDDADLFVSRKIVRQDQVRLLPGSGIDLDHFSPASPTSQIRFLFIGRLLGDKGVREFVEAAKLLRADRPDWQFQLLGPIDEGNRSAIKQAELDQWLADGCIEYLGEVEDVRPFIAAATAVVLPSYREGLPRSLLEAAAMARPLVASDVPGNRHIVRHGSNGFLCAARDPADLAKGMKQLASMSLDERDALGRAGRALVEREFGETRVIQAYLQALAQLCPTRRS